MRSPLAQKFLAVILLLGLFLVTPGVALADKASTRLIIDKITASSVGVFSGGSCGGVLVGPREVLTVAHCVADDPSKVEVESAYGQKVKAKSVIRNITRDLALIIIQVPLDDTQVAKISTDISQGDFVYVVGCPRGLCSFFTSGRISQFGVFPLQTEKGLPLGTAKQQHLLSDAWGFPGSSGGGWFDEDGNLVGVSVAEVTLETNEVGPHYILFAIGPEALQEWLVNGHQPDELQFPAPSPPDQLI